ncbi:MAG: hypothetical protein KDE01_11215, partial [Caldilineaceae bacterium]|nr:hypothetical protein [Caldilineaceae bacterium]
LSQYVWVLRDKLRQMHWGQTLGRPLLALLVMTLVVFLLRGFFLPASIAAGAATYLAMLFALGVVGRAEIGLLAGFRQQAGHIQG